LNLCANVGKQNLLRSRHPNQILKNLRSENLLRGRHPYHKLCLGTGQAYLT